MLPIPESGGAVPDFLAEVKWELDWLLTMQYAADDGRVSHKLTGDVLRRLRHAGGRRRPALLRPLRHRGHRRSSSRRWRRRRALYRPFDADFAARCLAAARVSYQLSDRESGQRRRQSGRFSHRGIRHHRPDDRLWAAAEIWETTGDAAALADVEARIAALTGRDRRRRLRLEQHQEPGPVHLPALDARRARPGDRRAVRASVMAAADDDRAVFTTAAATVAASCATTGDRTGRWRAHDAARPREPAVGRFDLSRCRRRSARLSLRPQSLRPIAGDRPRRGRRR